jgi:hypothetical protein
MIRDAASRIYSQSARIRVFILFVLLLVVPLFAYFSLHVTSRTTYFNDRNFRQLSNFSGQISERVDNLGVVFRNAVVKFVLEPPRDQSNKEDPKAKVDLNREFQNYLDILKTDGTDFTSTRVYSIPKATSEADLGLEMSIRVANEDGISWLYFDCEVKPLLDSNQKAEPSHFVAKTNFDRLIKPLVGRPVEEGFPGLGTDDEFSHILVLRGDSGKVLFELRNDDLRLTSLEHIALADSPDKVIDIKGRSKTTDAVDVSISGARYKLYEQPIEISLPTKNPENSEAKGQENSETLWVIAGLVEASRFRYQTWAISITVLIVVGFIAGILFLSWPFLKLVFIGPKDRLRLSEAYILAASVLVAGALLAFFVIFGVTYRELEGELDQQLTNLSNSFQKNFTTEVEQALQEIEKLDSQRLRQTQFENIMRTTLLREICEGGKCDREKHPYPFFKTAFWVDDAGQQVAKWSISNLTTKRVPVNTRDYFKKIREGSFHKLGSREFWLEPLSSMNTGGFTVAISRRAQPATQPDDKLKATVVALDTNLMSLTKPAMVAGYDYRIIDANGDVIFPRLKENVFAECENDHRLRSAVSGGVADFVSVAYLGRDYRVYVSPLRSFPEWTLIVFRDKEPVRSTYLEIVALSAALFIIYFLPFLLVLFMMFLLALLTGRRMKWIWPYPAAAPVYLQSIPISILLSVIAYALSYKVSDRNLIIFLSILSVAAWLILIGQMRFRLILKPSIRLTRYLKRRWTRVNYQSLYALCLVALVFVVAVLPALAFFRLAYDDQMDLFVKYVQVTLVNNLNEREQRVRAAYPENIFANEAAAKTFTKARLEEPLDRYDNFFFGTQVTGVDAVGKATADNHQRDWIHTFSKMLPFSSDSSIVRHGLIESQSAAGKWQWSGDGADMLSVQAPQSSSTGKAFVDVTSSTTHFRLTLFRLIFLSMIVPILFLLIRFVLKRLFLLDTIKISRCEAGIAVPKDTQKYFVVLGSPYSERQSLLQTANSKVLDLKAAGGDDEWLGKFDLEKFLAGTDTQSIVIGGFEYQIDRPQFNLEKLVLLERLVACQRALLVASTAEPRDYLFESADKALRIPGSDAAARWARVMSKFSVLYLEDQGDPHAFQLALDRIHSAGEDPANPATHQEKQRVAELFHLLLIECKPRACLHDIGLGIASQRDFRKSSPNKVLEEMQVQASTYYKLVWESCTPTEKCTLSHLASDGFLSVKDPDIPRLVRRGLIVRDPHVRMMNESFRLFVLNESRTDLEVEAAEGQARQTSSWQYLKVGLSATVIIIMVFLFATQRDLYNSTLIFVTSIAAGVPAIFNFFNMFQKVSGKSASPS